jgi:anti-sigma factor RsiW
VRLFSAQKRRAVRCVVEGARPQAGAMGVSKWSGRVCSGVQCSYASSGTGAEQRDRWKARRCGRRRLGGGLGGSQLPQSFQKEGATLPKQGSGARASLSGHPVRSPTTARTRLCCRFLLLSERPEDTYATSNAYALR